MGKDNKEQKLEVGLTETTKKKNRVHKKGKRCIRVQVIVEKKAYEREETANRPQTRWMLWDRVDRFKKKAKSEGRKERK